MTSTLTTLLSTRRLQHALLACAASAFPLVAPALAAQDTTSPTFPTVVTSAIPTDSAVPIGIDEAIRLAQRNSPQTIAARGTERNNRAAVRSAYGALLPSLSVNMGAVRQFPAGQSTRTNSSGETILLPSQPWSYSNGLSVNMTLFNGGQSLYDIRTARANTVAGEATGIAAQFAVALDVSQQFYNALAARESEAAARQQLELAEQQLRYSATRVRAGVATKSDSLRSLIQVGTAQLALLTAQTNLRSANAALTRLVGSDRLVTAAAADTVQPPIDAVALDTAALARLAEDGPAVRQAQSAYDAARISRRAARAPYLPTITAGYSRSGGGQSIFGFTNDPYSYGGSFRLGLSYPIFDQFSREERVVRADVAEDNASAALRDARLAARELLIQNVDQLRTAQERARVQQISVLAAEEDLRVQQQRYTAGASTLLDVLTSQNQLSQAQTALIQARFDARVARARLESLIGRSLTPAAR